MDTETTPATGSRVAERLITRNEAAFLIGAVHSGVANAISQVAQKYGTVFFNTNSSSPTEADAICGPADRAPARDRAWGASPKEAAATADSATGTAVLHENEITAATATITLDPDTIVADGPSQTAVSVAVTDAHNQPLAGRTVTLARSGDVTISAKGNVKIQGTSNVEATANVNMTLKGSAGVTVEASGVTQLKGAVVKVN